MIEDLLWHARGKLAEADLNLNSYIRHGERRHWDLAREKVHLASMSLYRITLLLDKYVIVGRGSGASFEGISWRVKGHYTDMREENVPLQVLLDDFDLTLQSIAVVATELGHAEVHHLPPKDFAGLL